SRTVIVADSAQAKEEASPSPSRAAPVHYTIVGIEYQKQITRALGRNEKTCEEKEDQEKKRNKKVTFFASWRKNRQQQPAGEDKLKRVTQRHLPPGTIIQIQNWWQPRAQRRSRIPFPGRPVLVRVAAFRPKTRSFLQAANCDPLNKSQKRSVESSKKQEKKTTDLSPLFLDGFVSQKEFGDGSTDGPRSVKYHK
ncbi:hypothetical protein pipiens_020178, partial [Culex pipiens pipiens]